jgi:hypothetical protein
MFYNFVQSRIPSGYNWTIKHVKRS